MSADSIRIIASFFIGYLTVRATCTLLDMRSNTVYAAIYVVNTFINLFLVKNSFYDGFRIFILNALVGLVIPICYSTGPLRVRLTRMGLIQICNAIGEIACTFTYLLIAGKDMRVTDFSTIDPLTASIIYVVGIATMHVSYEMAILTCKRNDSRYETSLHTGMGLSLILFNLGTYFLFAYILYRAQIRFIDRNALSFAFVFLVCIVLSFLLASIVFSVVSSDAQLARDNANRVGESRQVKHVKDEIAASKARSLTVRRLRHDLANQIDVVAELTREGKVVEADHYLALLQEQAQNLTTDPTGHHL